MFINLFRKTSVSDVNLSKPRKCSSDDSQNGSALVIAILVMVLMMGFVVLAISRSTTEMMITGNDSSEARAYAATEASLESTTRDFADVFEKKLAPDAQDIKTIQNKKVPGFEKFTFSQKIEKVRESTSVVLTGGNYAGLYALRDAWQIDSATEENASGVKVQLSRRFFSDRIPIFQFGIFFDDDLELNRPPLFTFGGRVHSNGNLFVTASAGAEIYFNSKVTAGGEIINDVWKPGTALTKKVDDWDGVYINDASGKKQQLKIGEGSVFCANVGRGILSAEALAKCVKNGKWETQKAKFQGNLENNVSKLSLPLTKLGVDLVELVRRPKFVGNLHNSGGATVAVTAATQDSDAVAKERFANKTGIRISLADSQAKLPGCAGVTAGTDCGAQLDAKLGSTLSIGYQPLAMTDGYQATALNATRIAMNGRGVWIKIETVSPGDGSAPKTADITHDILSLGVTEAAPGIGGDLKINGFKIYNGDWTDARSIIKLQRFSIPGGALPSNGATTYTSNYVLNKKAENLVVRYSNVTADPSAGCLGCTAVNSFAAPAPAIDALSSSSQEDAAHLKWAEIKGGAAKFAIVPFPIQIFDSREGLPNDNQAEADKNFGNGSVPSNGVMSLVDIDVANLRRFLNGSFDGRFPLGTPFAKANGKPLGSANIPQANGWVVYFSDRRGDHDFDGAYDMEDVFPNGQLEFNEDLNKNGILDVDRNYEAPSYTTAVARGQAATADHRYYRRGVRLINGSTLPGNYDSATPSRIKGFTFASENGVYVRGNYNSTGIGSKSTGTSDTPPENYLPQNTATHIPALIAGDAVIILSNNWNDAESFVHPFSANNRVASDTVVRFAMIAGDAVTGDKSFYSPSQFGQLNGGAHNFKRFLENWTSKRLNYSGSLINLFNSQNHNGFQKCCTTVYSSPISDWTFDTSFLNINRLPPGTPFIYSLSFTGFQRVND